MNKFLAPLLLLLSPSLLAGGYYNAGDIDTYDPASGLYFKSIAREKSGNGIIGSLSDGVEVLNINVFDPATGKSHLLFKGVPGGRIVAILFETGFKDGAVGFEGNDSIVKNNEAVPKRAPRNKVLVAVMPKDSEETHLLVADKSAGQLARFAVVPKNASWHVDVRNSKIRIVHQTGQSLRFESYEW